MSEPPVSSVIAVMGYASVIGRAGLLDSRSDEVCRSPTLDPGKEGNKLYLHALHSTVSDHLALGMPMVSLSVDGHRPDGKYVNCKDRRPVHGCED
jgi:hypothetical protein